MRLDVLIATSESWFPIEEVVVTPTGDPATTRQPSVVEVAAYSRADGKRVSVPVKLERLGGGRDRQEFELSISLEIPLPDARRKENITRYLQRVESKGQQEGASARDLAVLRHGRGLLMSMFDRIYMEHRVGLFEIVCTYTSRRAGAWQGQIQAAPVPVEVIYQGEFFDQPNFK